jgi:glycosyltransferase 2 family protein
MNFMGRSLKFFAGVLVTGLCLWLVLRHIDWGEAWSTIQAADAQWLFLGLVLLTTGYACRVLRWWLMLRSMSPGLAFSGCIGPFLSSMAINNVVPFRAGDVLRVVGFRRHLDIDPIPVTSTLVLERLLDLSALLGFFFVGLLFVDQGLFPPAVVITTGWIACFCFVLVVVTVMIPHRLQGIADALARTARERAWPLPGRIATGLREFFSSLAAMRTPRLMAQLLTLSITIWFLEGGVFMAVAYALDIRNAGVGPWFALATGTLGTLLPSTPGYVGTFDYFTMLGLMAYHVPQNVSAVFALAVHLLLWLPVTIVGLGWLMVHKLNPSQASVEMTPSVTSTT